MQNLYDLLGVRRDDDAESLRKAYRKAAKASHPDHHGGDPEAAARFRRITQAYAILRDAAKRAAYDRLLEAQLEVQRRPLRAKLKRTLIGLKRHLVTGAIVGVVLPIGLVGGYELLAHKPEIPIHETVGMTAQREPAGAAAVEAAKAPPVPDSPGQTIDVVTGYSESNAPVDQAATMASLGDPGKSQAGEPPDSRTAPSGDGQFGPEKHDGASRPPTTGVAASDVRHDGRTPEPAGAIAGDAKRTADTRGVTRPPMAARRRHSLEQASLEGRSAVDGSHLLGCPGPPFCTSDRPRRNPPPLSGVGF
jgi:curved DNA-binding protein CbpA